jgi:hypothetical protein
MPLARLGKALSRFRYGPLSDGAHVRFPSDERRSAAAPEAEHRQVFPDALKTNGAGVGITVPARGAGTQGDRPGVADKGAVLVADNAMEKSQPLMETFP